MQLHRCIATTTTTGSSTGTATRWILNERCQARCRLCFVPSWLVCFEFTVQSSLHTFLVLIVLATEVERGQQNSASEKPSEEFEHSPEGNKDTDGSRQTRHKPVYAWAKHFGVPSVPSCLHWVTYSAKTALITCDPGDCSSATAVF